MVAYLVLSLVALDAEPLSAVTLFHVMGDTHVIERAFLKDGELVVTPVWTAKRPGLTPHFVSSGAGATAILCSDAQGRSQLQLFADAAPEEPLAVFHSRLGFSFAWMSPTLLRIAGDGQGLETRYGETVVKVTPKYMADHLDMVFSERQPEVERVKQAMQSMDLKFAVGLRANFYPFGANGSGAFDTAADRFVLTRDGAEGKHEVVLYSIAEPRQVAVLTRQLPRSLTMGGGLVAIVEGEWDQDGVCRFYTSADGRYLGSRKVRGAG
jgi:hypothetical protein